jgi:hypothetical protein
MNKDKQAIISAVIIKSYFYRLPVLSCYRAKGGIT